MAANETATPIPDPAANYLMNFFTSRDNKSDPATYVGQQARMWWNPRDNTIYVSDGVTPGGVAVTGGGGGGNPAGPNGAIQFNDNGVFGGNIQLTYDKTTGTLTSNALNFTNALYIGGTLFTRTLTVGRATTPVTVPLSSNNTLTVLGANGQDIPVYTT